MGNAVFTFAIEEVERRKQKRSQTGTAGAGADAVAAVAPSVAMPTSTPAPTPTPAPEPVPTPAPVLSLEPTSELEPEPEPALAPGPSVGEIIDACGSGDASMATVVDAIASATTMMLLSVKIGTCRASADNSAEARDRIAADILKSHDGMLAKVLKPHWKPEIHGDLCTAVDFLRKEVRDGLDFVGDVLLQGATSDDDELPGDVIEQLRPRIAAALCEAVKCATAPAVVSVVVDIAVAEATLPKGLTDEL